MTHKSTRMDRDAYIVDEVTQTAECQDEKVNLAQQRALPRLIVCMQVVADLLRHHLELPRRIDNPPKLSCKCEGKRQEKTCRGSDKGNANAGKGPRRVYSSVSAFEPRYPSQKTKDEGFRWIFMSLDFPRDDQSHRVDAPLPAKTMYCYGIKTGDKKK